MANLIFKKGKFKILAKDLSQLDAKETNELIKKAGTVSHQSRDKSKKPPKDFVKMLMRMGHFSVLEHSWYTFKVFGDLELIAKTFLSNSLFCISRRSDSFLLSGNSRMFLEGYQKTKNKLLSTLLAFLNNRNPVLFPKQTNGFESSDFKFEYNPELETKKEKLIHKALTVEFNNHSRGFTHEDVRSRNGDGKVVAYTQESTRYVDYAKGKKDIDKAKLGFILPYNTNYDFDQKIEFSLKGKSYSFTPQEFTDLLENWYKALRKSGLKPEEARQWLPIGIKSQIVQTYNLNEWRHWFKIRAQKPAHPEIRTTAVELLKSFQKLFPNLFNGFEFGMKKDNTPYAHYTGNDKLA